MHLSESYQTFHKSKFLANTLFFDLSISTISYFTIFTLYCSSRYWYQSRCVPQDCDV